MKATEIRGERKGAGIVRQAQLARELGIGSETLVDIELGRIGIDEETLARIRAAIQRLKSTNASRVPALAGRGRTAN